MSLKIVIVSNYVKQICMTYLLTFESSNKARDSASTLLVDGTEGYAKPEHFDSGETADVTLASEHSLCQNHG